MKRLISERHEIADLEVIECDCGYHMGIDASYVLRVGDFKTNCPSCGKEIDTAVILADNVWPERRMPGSDKNETNN